MAPKIGLVGNCQVKTYAALIRKILPECEISVIDFSTPDAYFEKNRCQFLSKLNELDFVFAQDVGLSHVNLEALKAEASKCAVAAICNFYFRGTFPDTCYVGAQGKRGGYFDYNSVIAIHGFLKGLSIEECIKLYNVDTFVELNLFEAWGQSLAEQQSRDARLDFPGVEYVKNATWKYCAFRTVNHPSERLLAEYIFDILKNVGVGSYSAAFNFEGDPLHFFEQPVYDFLADFYKTPYRTPQYWRVNGRFISLSEYVSLNYKSYAEVAREDLVVHSPKDLLKTLSISCPDFLSP